jgi:N-acetylglucosaminyl-diphospho-decaprenol L-rhamnosyltransferase
MQPDRRSVRAWGSILAVRLSYCVVNTDGREDLLACLDAIESTAPAGIEAEVTVLDNASGDGSADAVRAREGEEIRLIALERREGKAANDSRLLRDARGEYCLLLNEDAELTPGATAALIAALDAHPEAAAAGAQLMNSDGSPAPCAWRLPGWRASIASALFLHKRLVTQSGGAQTREVGWVQSSAMLVRRAAAQEVGYLDPAFFVYSDETDFCKRLHDAGWSILHVPGARAVHHDQLASDSTGADRRLVEFSRNRDLYLRKHLGRASALLLRPVLAFPNLVRAAYCALAPGRSPRRYLALARAAIQPRRGEGIREAAEAYNAALPG